MSKHTLAQALAAQITEGKKLFVPYIVAGEHGFDTLKETILFLEKCGVSAIELGIPFSEPVADGPTIQDAGQRALKRGVTLEKVLTFLASFTERKVPILLMTYINPIFVYGIDRFAEDCQKAQVSGVIIPDVPMEEEKMIAPALTTHDIAFIRLAAMTSTKDRLTVLAQKSEGFLYAASVTGTTGTRAAHDEAVYTYLKHLKEISSVPVLAGFGVSSVEQAQKLQAQCDGVIVGSKIVELLAENEYEAVQTLIQNSMQVKAHLSS